MDNLHEEWRPVPDWEGLYSVSSNGQVRRETSRVRKFRKHILSQQTTKSGYKVILLRGPGRKQKRFFVHRLVTAAFLGELPDGQQVNHKDADKANNSVRNLEYVTAAANIRHARKRGLVDWRGSRNGQAKLTEADVRRIRAAFEAGERTSVVARRFGVHPTTVCDIKYRRTWAHLD